MNYDSYNMIHKKRYLHGIFHLKTITMVEFFIMMTEHVLIESSQWIPESSQDCFCVLQRVENIEGLVQQLHLIEL